MSSLRAYQESFWSVLTARTSAADALRQQPTDAWLAEVVRGDDGASALERIDVYANMYFHRLLELLAQDFPVLSAALGAARFHSLVVGYLHACPSSHPSVRHLGRALPTYLRECGEQRWQAELAALEWARNDLADRADQAVLTQHELRAFAVDAWTGLELQLVAAHARLPITRAVDVLWRHARDGVGADEQSASAAVSRTLVIWRKPDLTVHHRPLARDENALFSSLRRGVTVSELCARLGANRSDEEAAHRTITLLAAWTAEGLLTRRCLG